MSKTGLTDRANSDKVGEIKGEKISEGIFNKAKFVYVSVF